MKKLSIPLMAISLVGSCSLFGGTSNDSQEGEWNPNQAPSSSAFNAPARIEIKASGDVFVTANFTYWNPIQENMELGIVSETGDSVYAVDGDVVRQNFDYTPGFQVGIGMNLNRDGWDLFAQYTWLRNTDTVTTSLDAGGDDVLVPFWMKPDTSNPKFYHGKERWHLAMDIGDFEMGRSYYVGSALTFRPFFGVRGAFIRQKLNVSFSQESTGFLAHESVFVKQNTHSWGGGPRAGLDMNWLLGQGVRLYGVGSADILFTQYTTLKWEEFSRLSSGAKAPNSGFKVEEEDLNYVRTHLDLELGFGWGTYLGKGNYHFDISAGYGFQVFFGQNMFRSFVDDSGLNSNSPSGDLFIQGFTLATRLDF